MKPYCIEINLVKPRITFHYKGKPDKVIDKKTCFSFVEKSIDKHMPGKKEINEMVGKQIHAYKTSIEQSLTIPETSKEKLLKEYETKEGIVKVTRQIVNRLHNEIKEKQAEGLLKEHINKSINDEWLKAALQLVKG